MYLESVCPSPFTLVWQTTLNDSSEAMAKSSVEIDHALIERVMLAQLDTFEELTGFHRILWSASRSSPDCGLIVLYRLCTYFCCGP